MIEQAEQHTTLSSYRKKGIAWPKWVKFFAFLKNPNSVFYFIVATILIGFLWSLYGLVENSFTSAFNWDYSHQYLPFAYDYHDTWRTFFTTGQFPLFDANIFVGTDNIGANSYYGLFDPFIILMAFFPKAWIPQLYAMATIARCTFAAAFMRMFLRYRGIKEWTARFGAIATAFSGYVCFMVGFPNFVSAVTYVPLILYGIERVLKEQKPGALILGVFLMEISCFMLVVTMCIWGVIYAVWRFFATIKERDAKTNWLTMGVGVMGFAIGIMAGSWSLLPSIRVSSLSGRTSSIGSAYMHSLFDAVKAKDFVTLFGLLFEEVGDNPGRTLMGLVSFFYPTGGYLTLPLIVSTGNVYDAWTASIFCYTPFVILFFQGVIHSILQKRYSHIFAILGCVFLVFTTFAYYFFFGFSGNGYGRWFFVLVPLIVYYGCWAFDQRRTAPRWVPLAGSAIALVGSVLAFCAVYWALENLTFSAINGMTYFKSSYIMPDELYQNLNRFWYVWYEAGLIAVEGIIFFAGCRKKWLPYVMCGIVAAEAIAAGNCGYLYVGLWDMDTAFMGGSATLATNSQIADNIAAYDSSFYRAFFDGSKGTTNFAFAAGYNDVSSFHSLLNFGANDFGIMNKLKNASGTATTYGGETYMNATWTSVYRNKKMGLDQVLGYRYYVIENENGLSSKSKWVGVNVPFGAEEVPELSVNRDTYRVYRVSEDYLPSVGHAIDSSKIYRLGKDGNYSNFYPKGINSGDKYFRQQKALQEVEMLGAIIDDDVELPAEFAIAETPEFLTDAAMEANFDLTRLSVGNGLNGYVYTVNSGDKLWPASDADYADEGVTYFMNHYAEKTAVKATDKPEVTCGVDHFVLTPDDGEYFNTDIRGCYIDLKYYNSSYSTSTQASWFKYMPRILVVGDALDENGNVLENQVLSYDATTFKRVADLSVDMAGYNNGTIGIYAKGKAKAVVLIWPDWVKSNGDLGVMKVSTNTINMYVEDFTALENKKYNFFRENALNDMKSSENRYTFSTNYSESKIVVTQFGYDEGWQCRVTTEDGKTENCTMLRLDGGLTGFIAPKGKNTYVLQYKTPYFALGATAAIVGLAAFGAYTGLRFYLRRKKRDDGKENQQAEAH
ncbi:MAG: YfhO family protein [Bacilli bacterium]|nr:YfhO family protein [Bacilli bacterium]